MEAAQGGLHLGENGAPLMSASRGRPEENRFQGAATALDFFAGSGLVRVGLEPHFQTVWANDNCAKKAAVYQANFGAADFYLGSIEDVRGVSLPRADLAWASFPCQDLSLAGNMEGMKAGTRSGLFWEWLRVLDEMSAEKKRPSILVAENVVGFLVADGGAHFKAAYDALRERGYRAGAVVVDARHFLPQSRPRAFLIAAERGIELDGLTQRAPSEPFHTRGVRNAAGVVSDPEWVWWSLPLPSERPPRFMDLYEPQAECASTTSLDDLEHLLSPLNRNKLEAALGSKRVVVGTGYRRTRPMESGGRQQRLELRFDGVAGCLRTPEGGSSRQVVVVVEKGRVRTRLMTVRECARLMGAPEGYEIPGSYNDGYRAMGDAVAVPVTRWLAQHILAPLSQRRRKRRAA
jgi:DNA (cytosine-5)-methyltransferase 1